MADKSPPDTPQQSTPIARGILGNVQDAAFNLSAIRNTPSSKSARKWLYNQMATPLMEPLGWKLRANNPVFREAGNSPHTELAIADEPGTPAHARIATAASALSTPCGSEKQMIACVYPRSHVVGSGSGNAGAALESEASATEQHSAASMGSEAVDSPASCGSDAATDLLEGGDPTPRPTSRTLGLEEPSFVTAQRVAAEAGDLPGQKPQPEALRPAQPLPGVDREAALVPSVDPAEAEEAALPPPLATSAEKARSSLLSYYAQTGETRTIEAGAEPRCVTLSPTDAPAPSSSGKVSRVLTRLPGALPLVVRGLVLLGLLAGLAWVPLTGPPHLLSRAASPAPGLKLVVGPRELLPLWRRLQSAAAAQAPTAPIPAPATLAEANPWTLPRAVLDGPAAALSRIVRAGAPGLAPPVRTKPGPAPARLPRHTCGVDTCPAPWPEPGSEGPNAWGAAALPSALRAAAREGRARALAALSGGARGASQALRRGRGAAEAALLARRGPAPRLPPPGELGPEHDPGAPVPASARVQAAEEAGPSLAHRARQLSAWVQAGPAGRVLGATRGTMGASLPSLALLGPLLAFGGPALLLVGVLAACLLAGQSSTGSASTTGLASGAATEAPDFPTHTPAVGGRRRTATAPRPQTASPVASYTARQSAKRGADSALTGPTAATSTPGVHTRRMARTALA
ncbi:hypothetical protein ACKKBG_A30885 [Auxenochlorella protothecoides x Auxenochlorella symbiontica]